MLDKYELDLSGNNLITLSGIRSLTRHQKKLVVLRLSSEGRNVDSCDKITDYSVLLISGGLKDLEEL